MDQEKKREYLELLQKARVRSFYSNLLAYILINSLLVGINLVVIFSNPGPRSILEFWAIWPLVGWGIGVVFQGYYVFFASKDEMRLRELEVELGIPPKRNDR